MSIPLERLYHFIEKKACEIYGNAVIIYRFWPSGSKKMQDLSPMPTHFNSWSDYQVNPAVWCHDQEPLAHKIYSEQARNNKFNISTWLFLLEKFNLMPLPQNLNHTKNIFQKNLLLHSEKRSQNVEKYIADNELVPVYYWCHALIARDWFRYAEHENFIKKIKRHFLIYNRAWSGTREYRLKFADLLIKNDLVDHCWTFCEPVQDGQHYKDYNFANNAWRPDHVLEHYFQPSVSNACASADFNIEDYQSTGIEVVLETLFDDDRLHLTEKSLRPIACAQPFILAATHGSLQYLRDYGFRTFDTVWDESYDLIQNPGERLQAIIDLMADISAWSDSKQLEANNQIQQIVDHNQKHFFSKDFFNIIINELQTNMRSAFGQIAADPGFDKWIKRWQNYLDVPEIQDFITSNQDYYYADKKQYDFVIKHIEQYSKSFANNKQ